MTTVGYTTDIYSVEYHVHAPRFPLGTPRRAYPKLSAGYSTFTDLPKILAAPLGVQPEQIRVIAAVRVGPTPEQLAAEVGFDVEEALEAYAETKLSQDTNPHDDVEFALWLAHIYAYEVWKE